MITATFQLDGQVSSSVVASSGSRGIDDRLAESGMRAGIVVSDGGLPPAVVNEYLSELENPPHVVLDIPNHQKTLITVEMIYGLLFDHEVNAGRAVVALGGNVLLDAVGFAAATYARGVPAVYVPTTLLSQVDGSHGGATAVHFRGVTNLVGSWRLPHMTWVDPSVLAHLPTPELRAGIAEVLKQCAVGDAAMFEQLAEQGDLSRLSLDDLHRLVENVVVRKSEIARTDDVSLNFGHTLAHAIEGALGHRGVRHGEAVSVGMAAVSRASALADLCSDEVSHRIVEALRRNGLPTDLNELCGDNAPGIEDLRPLVTRDKKRIADRSRWIIAPTIGSYNITDMLTLADVYACAKGH